MFPRRYPRIAKLCAALVRGEILHGKSKLKETFTLGPHHQATGQDGPRWALIVGPRVLVFDDAFTAAEATDCFLRYGSDVLST